MDETRLLLTPEDVVSDAFDELPIRLPAVVSPASDEDTRIRNGFIEAIKHQTALTERFLNRKLLVRRTIQRIEYCDWKYVWGYEFAEAPLREFPLVQVISVATDQGVDVTSEYGLHTETRKQNRFMRGPNVYRQITLTAYTGYRRGDHTLRTLQDFGDDYSGITTLPMELPDDIRRVISSLAAHRISLSGIGQWGQGRKVQSTAKVGVQIDNEDRGYEQRKLRELIEHQL